MDTLSEPEIQAQLDAQMVPFYRALFRGLSRGIAMADRAQLFKSPFTQIKNAMLHAGTVRAIAQVLDETEDEPAPQGREFIDPFLNVAFSISGFTGKESKRALVFDGIVTCYEHSLRFEGLTLGDFDEHAEALPAGVTGATRAAHFQPMRS